MTNTIEAFSVAVLYNKVTNKLYSDCLIGRPGLKSWRQVLALWDTGATNSAITTRLAQECGLSQSGEMGDVGSLRGTEKGRPKYLADLYLGNGLLFPEIEVYAPKDSSFMDAEVLIGMDIIGEGDLILTRRDGELSYTLERHRPLICPRLLSVK